MMNANLIQDWLKWLETLRSMTELAELRKAGATIQTVATSERAMFTCYSVHAQP